MSGGNVWTRRSVVTSLSAGALGLAAKVSGQDLVFSFYGRTIDAPSGPYEALKTHGFEEGQVWTFPAIRYGRAKRFAAPIAVQAAQQEIGKTDNGALCVSCPQTSDRYKPQSEDCLFLNVWSKAEQTRRQPVLVYFHGGAYSNGSVADELTHGHALAQYGDVVVVTVNHRLNAFGYLSLGRIDPRFPDSGNAGQLDLVLALQWVQRNIAAFGGDPGNVTVFGQSGGGAKIATLMAMPAAKGLFHKAITMSGQQVTVSGPLHAEKRARAYLARLGIDPVTAPIDRLVAALDAIDPVLGGSVYLGPVLDGRSLTRHPFYPDAAPQSRAIPMLLGNTLSETRTFFGAGHPRIVGLDWTNIATRIAPELRVDIDPALVIAQYRTWFPKDTPAALFIRATTASRSWRGQVIEAEERAKVGVPAFVYQLDFEDAKHTDDIGLVFGTLPDMTPAKAAMSKRMMSAFVRFARTGDPGWPAYDLDERKTMMFDTVSRVEHDPRGREREVFAKVPYVQPGT